MNDHFVYWLGEDGNVWVKQNGNTKNIGKAIMRNGQWNGNPESEMISMPDNGTRIDNPNPTRTNNTRNTSSSSSNYYSRLAAQQAAANARKASEASNIKNSMMGRRGEFQNILNDIISNIDTTYREESSKRKKTYDKDAAALLDTLEKALPSIAASFANIGAYDSSLRGYREIDAEKEHQASQEDLAEEYDNDMANLGNKANQARVEARNSYNNFMTDFDTLNNTEANADNLENIRSSQNSLLKGLNDFRSQCEMYKPNSTFASEMKNLGGKSNFENLSNSLKNFLTNAGASSSATGGFNADEKLSADTKEATKKAKSEIETNKATGVTK